MVRTFEHEKVTRMAAVSKVPVINALTDDYHPCQLLADLQTYQEHRGNIAGKTVCWVGDGNNMCNTFIDAAQLLDFELVISSPEGYDPMPSLVNANKDRVRIVRDPKQAVVGASMVATDVWASMGQEAQAGQRREHFAGFTVNEELMGVAHPDAVFLHCLPAHRGEEVSHEVLEGSHNRVWRQAENRMHAARGLLAWLLASGGAPDQSPSPTTGR